MESVTNEIADTRFIGYRSMDDVALCSINTKSDKFATFTTPANCNEIYLVFRASQSKVYPRNTKVSFNNVMLREASVKLPYTPYYKTSIPLSSEILNLPDYGCSVGDVYNYVDFENMVYHHRVKKYDDMSKFVDIGYNDSYFYSSDLQGIKKFGDFNVICSKYQTATKLSSATGMDDFTIKGNTSSGNIFWKDSKYTNSNDMRESLKGVSICVELATEELIPLTDLLLPFKCEPGGTVTFENEHNLDVPNTVIYEKEMK